MTSPEKVAEKIAQIKKVAQITRDLTRKFFDTHLKGGDASQILKLEEKYSDELILNHK